MAWAVRRRAGVCGLLRRSLVVFVSRAAVRRSADLLQRSALPPTVCVTSERERESRGRSPSLESENSKKQPTFRVWRTERDRCVVCLNVMALKGVLNKLPLSCGAAMCVFAGDV